MGHKYGRFTRLFAMFVEDFVVFLWLLFIKQLFHSRLLGIFEISVANITQRYAPRLLSTIIYPMVAYGIIVQKWSSITTSSIYFSGVLLRVWAFLQKAIDFQYTILKLGQG